MGIDALAELILREEGVSLDKEVRSGAIMPAAMCRRTEFGAVLFVIRRSDGLLQGECVVALADGGRWEAVGSFGSGWPDPRRPTAECVEPVLGGAVGRYAATAGLACGRVVAGRLLDKGSEEAELTELLLPSHWIMCWDADDEDSAAGLVVIFADGESHVVPRLAM